MQVSGWGQVSRFLPANTVPPHSHSTHRSTKTLLMQPLKLRMSLDLGEPPRRS